MSLLNLASSKVGRRLTLATAVLCSIALLGVQPARAADEITLREELENFLAKRQGDISPALYAELKEILKKHGGNQPSGSPASEAKSASPKSASPSVSGAIEQPKDGAEVGTRIMVVATANVPNGRHVWLATKRGNLVWPKEPEVRANGRKWAGVVFEGGTPGKLDLVLLEVDDAGHADILAWFEHGRAVNEWSGKLPEEFGAKVLDAAKDLDFRP